MALFVLRKLILQTQMRSHPVGLDVWFLVGPFVYFHTSCVQTAKALVRLRGCAGSLEPSQVAYVISTIISWAGSFLLFHFNDYRSTSKELWNLLIWNLSINSPYTFLMPFLVNGKGCVSVIGKHVRKGIGSILGRAMIPKALKWH